MLNKYEYVENANKIAWHHEFESSFEYQNGFSIDLAGRFKSPVVGGGSLLHAYKLKLKKGYIFWNIQESVGFKNLVCKFSSNLNNRAITSLVEDLEKLFEIRAKYPSLDLLKEYYFEADMRDVEEFLRHFEDIFEAVVERCGSQYRHLVMQGATELAFARLNKWNSPC